MLSVSSYPGEYVLMCASRIDEQLSSYECVKVAAGADRKALDTFEPLFLENTVLSLDALFGHRARGKEGKDGNPLNEVRMICGSLMKGEARLLADSTIRYDPATSILGTRIGEHIRWTPGGVRKLCQAFLDEIERKYP